MKNRAGMWVAGWLLLAPAAFAAEAPRDAMQYFFDSGFGSLPDEVAAARKNGQMGVMVMFEAEDCPWCAKMKANVLSLPSIQDYYHRHFRLLIMDVNGDVTMTDFNRKEMPQRDFAFKHDRLRATPVFSFFDLNGQVMTRYVGATRDAEEFRWLGEYVVSGKWKTVNFTAYKRERSGGKP